MKLLARMVSLNIVDSVSKETEEIASWQSDACGGLRLRNSSKASVNWRFKITDAPKKMGRLYPDVTPCKVALPDH